MIGATKIVQNVQNDHNRTINAIRTLFGFVTPRGGVIALAYVDVKILARDHTNP
ncbi:hypothetical protein [Nocardiopsis rhodophaea]|uniref:hypothetical protein n=1 Tax=Nocardiopsis rhodophaea TaxID=280238 RepID=UPI0031D94AFD